MRFRNSMVLILALVTGLAAAQARSKGKDKAWSEPFDDWSHNQVMQLLKDSPWARSQNVASIIDTKNAGMAGEKDLFYVFTGRFFSALPVREGYVRLYQLLNDYGSMNALHKQQFDAKFMRALDLDVSKQVIFALEFSTNDPQASRNVANFLYTATKDTFSQSAYLITDRLGRVQLDQYFPPSPDGTGAKFIFPRFVNGQPVVSPEDNVVRVDIYMPPVNQRIFLEFKPPEMAYEGKLAY